MRTLVAVVVASAASLAACDFGRDVPLGGAIEVRGDVVDFQTDATVSAGVSVTASGISPAPMISTQGATFSITDVPENSVFQILAAASGYRATFSEVIEVTDDDVTDVRARVLSDAYVNALAAAFNVTPTAAKGIVIVRFVDGSGAPRANLPAAQLLLAGSTTGPFFLDAQGNPAAGATATSASGYAVWFEVTPGITEAGQAAAATITIDMATSPVAAGHVTLAVATVSDGAPPPLPTNVSFAASIVPIFTARGCVACHGANGAGKGLGNLDLNGGAPKIYSELVEERPGIRVNTMSPGESLVLTKPLLETPPNHQNATFQNTLDADYRKLFVWIKEGAKNN